MLLSLWCILMLSPSISSLDFELADIRGFLILSSSSDKLNMYIVHKDWTYNPANFSADTQLAVVDSDRAPLSTRWPELFKSPLLSTDAEADDILSVPCDTSNCIHLLLHCGEKTVQATIDIETNNVNISSSTIGIRLHSSLSSKADFVLSNPFNQTKKLLMYKNRDLDGQTVFMWSKELSLKVDEENQRGAFYDVATEGWKWNTFQFGAGFVFNKTYYLLVPEKEKFFIFTYPSEESIWPYRMENVLIESENAKVDIAAIVCILLAVLFLLILLTFFLLRKNEAFGTMMANMLNRQPNHSLLVAKSETIPEKGQQYYVLHAVPQQQTRAKNTIIASFMAGTDPSYAETSGVASDRGVSNLESPSKLSKSQGIKTPMVKETKKTTIMLGVPKKTIKSFKSTLKEKKAIVKSANKSQPLSKSVKSLAPKTKK